MEITVFLSKQTLLELLSEQPCSHNLSNLDPDQLAHFFVNTAFLTEVMGFLKEQLWITSRGDLSQDIERTYEDFITPFFTEKISSLIFLKNFLIERGPKKIKKITKTSISLEREVIDLIKSKSKVDQKEFIITSLKEMELLFLKEEGSKVETEQSLGQQGIRLYRTFDKLDELFALNYQLDLDMLVDHESKERLYQRSGVGVQSGYSTILLALNRMEAPTGSTVVDLGSGYGRVGLVCSLIRPDIKFLGYEYVPHRVEISNSAVRALGLEDSLVFKVQDLSLKSFSVPIADFYYLYDPFSEETYKYILDQIVRISQERDITIVTKGNARNWLVRISKDHSWPSPIYIDDSNLCIFRSFIK